MPRIATLICLDCGKNGPAASVMPEARKLAEQAGWQTGMRGQVRVEGWEDDYCETCKLNHVRVYCDGVKRRTCKHRSIYTITREKPHSVAHSCGSHFTLMAGELIRGGHKIEVEETPV